MEKQTATRTRSSRRKLAPEHKRLKAELEELRLRLAEAEDTLRAIQSGDVDAVVVAGPQGERVFTLRGAEHAYRVLVETMNEGAVSIAPDGTILYCNQHVPSILQLPPEKVIGQSVREFITTADRNTFDALFELAMAGESCKAEVQFQVGEASLVPAYLSLSRAELEDASAVCMVITDLREHKRRDELINEGSLARSILEHAREAIAVCDQYGRIVLANDGLRHLCGGDPLLQQFDDILRLEMPSEKGFGESNTTRFSALPITLNGETIRAEKVLLRRDNGQVSWLLLTAGPLLNHDEVVGSILTLVDITKHKQAEKALLRSEKLAATGQLAATIAHEINNPLSAVFNLLYLIEHATTPEQVRAHADMALTELARVSNITKQTLAFYRDSNRPENLKISEVLNDIVALFGKEFQAKHVTCAHEYAVAGQICGHPGELRQVFSNLIRNAIDAVSEHGHIRMVVRKTRRAGNDGIAVFISDNGSGIAPEVRDHIFEPFFTTKGRKGTGLGLWVASDLVHKHGGMIRVRSSHMPGRNGTCFYVFLPCASTGQDEVIP